MVKEPELEFDEIGYWSEIKLSIVKKYAKSYSSIMNKQRESRCRIRYYYIDAFSGAGKHISDSTGEYVDGSPIIALETRPEFDGYHFIDLNSLKADELRRIVGENPKVNIYNGDCNVLMINEILPNIQFNKYTRALCLLDPYGLHLDWKVIQMAGQSAAVDMFLNFPVMDINRNALWKTPENVSEWGIERMNRFWGDDSWRSALYKPAKQIDLFKPNGKEKVCNEDVVACFTERLKSVAGFKVVLSMAMRNDRKAVVYYLIFASQKPVAYDIIRSIFKTYGDRQEDHG